MKSEKNPIKGIKTKQIVIEKIRIKSDKKNKRKYQVMQLKKNPIKRMI